MAQNVSKMILNSFWTVNFSLKKLKSNVVNVTGFKLAFASYVTTVYISIHLVQIFTGFVRYLRNFETFDKRSYFLERIKVLHSLCTYVFNRDLHILVKVTSAQLHITAIWVIAWNVLWHLLDISWNQTIYFNKTNVTISLWCTVIYIH